MTYLDLHKRTHRKSTKRSRRYRNHKGQFRDSKAQGFGLLIMIALLAFMLIFQKKPRNSDGELISPIPRAQTFLDGIPQAQAEEPEVEIVEVVDTRTQEEQILDKIEEVFGEDAEDAKKIAKCESGLNPNAIGDQHIMGELDGEQVGDSIGIYQIRTGNKGGVYDKSSWNRAKANGMSVEEFRTKLKDFNYNIEYARDIYDRSGWKAWFNCMNKVL